MSTYMFNNHLTLYISYLGMNYSNVMGYLLIQVFMLQFISGILLSCYYSPFYTIAFDSMYYMMIDMNYGWLMRWYHIMGASLFMLFIIFHWLRGFWLMLKMIDLFYSFLMWFSGMLLLICSMIEGFLGYILNWGQMSYWGINVMINIISNFYMFNIISISKMIIEFIWCSCNVIINRIFLIHFSLGWLLGMVIIIHLFFLHSFSSCNSLFNSYSSLIIPFFPLFYNDIFVTFIWCSFSYYYFLFSEPDLFGNSDNLIFANAVMTPNHILPEWYFLIFYSTLSSMSNNNYGMFSTLLMLILIFV